MPANQMLLFYAGHFNTTEINYSFHRIPSLKSISEWSNSTPAQFKFSFKAPQKVTHWARLQNSADTLDYFAGVLGNMGGKLGPVLFQLPPDFPKDTPLLKFFLETKPATLRAAFEFRHVSWFDDEVFSALREHNAALCLAESERLQTPLVVTADFGYLRLRRDDYAAEEFVRWADFVCSQEQRWHEAFAYFKHEESGKGPLFAHELKRLLAMSGEPVLLRPS